MIHNEKRQTDPRSILRVHGNVESQPLGTTSYVDLLKLNESPKEERLLNAGYAWSADPYVYATAHPALQEMVARAVTTAIRDTYTTKDGEALYPLPLNDHSGALAEIQSGKLLPYVMWGPEEKGHDGWRARQPVGVSASIERPDGMIELGRTGKVRNTLHGGLSLSPILTARITDALENRQGQRDRGMEAFYSDVRVIGDRHDGILSGRWIQRRFMTHPTTEQQGYGFSPIGLSYLYCVNGNEPFMQVVRPFSQEDFVARNRTKKVVIPAGNHVQALAALWANMGLPDSVLVESETSSKRGNMQSKVGWEVKVPPNKAKLYWQLVPEQLGHGETSPVASEKLLYSPEDAISQGPFVLAWLPATSGSLPYATDLINKGFVICGIKPAMSARDTETQLLYGRFGAKVRDHGYYEPDLDPMLYNQRVLAALRDIDYRLRKTA